MPISDTYVVQYLLQETLLHHGALAWTEKEPDSYTANLHGIEVELFTLTLRSGSRVHITLSYFPERIDINEPLNKGLFREKYEDDNEALLAHTMQELARTVARQCAARINRTPEAAESVREYIFRRLIGAEGNEHG